MDQKNVILAVVVSVAILLVWQILIEQPRVERERALRLAQQTTETQSPPTPGAVAPTAPGATAPATPGIALQPGVPPSAAAPAPFAREAQIAQGTRIKLESPKLLGSIALQGATIDDVVLASYRESTAPDSRQITLLSPFGAKDPYVARFGWLAADKDTAVPQHDTLWTADRRDLRPGAPLTMSWNNGQGLVFQQMIALDENYMFTVTQRVRNEGARAQTVYPFGLVHRVGTPPTAGFFILHEGMIGVLNGTLKEIDYDGLKTPVEAKTTGGWVGITDKYWLVALIPDQKAEAATRFAHVTRNKTDEYQVDYRNSPMSIEPGQTVETASRLFAGAKEVRLLDRYETELGINRFDLAVDFGWFYFLTKPIFYVLDYFNGMLGNFGLAILLLTVLIKILFFPLANKSYKAMSRLKHLQPKMMEIRERFKDDRVKQNEAMMELYKKSNANPMSGCLPIVIQIPVFFALYKVLFVTIEMRHAPFYGWIKDLSVADPTTLFNLFGLIPWTPPEFLFVGGWPIIMGATMFLQQKLNPAPPDPIQARIFMLLPLIFTFVLAPFPAGLVIYWAWNNILSVGQQWLIMRRTPATVKT